MLNQNQNPDILVKESNFLDHHPNWLLPCLVVLFLLASVIRIKEIQAPGLLIEREYTSAIFARHFYFDENETVEPWRSEIATITKERQPVVEPPLTEFLVSLFYRVTGREELWYARILTSTFWLVGGIFLFKTARLLLSVDASVVATTYYLFVPSGILTSRSFQPDSLMMMMYLASLFCIVRYFFRPSLNLLLIAAVVSGTTLLVRPLVLFAIFGAFIALSIYFNRSWKRVINRSFIIFSTITFFFILFYYGYGILIADFLRWKVDDSFRPFLLLRSVFWHDWFQLGVSQIGYTALIAALLGFPLLNKKPVQALSLGLAVGYIIFGVVFTFHIHTHGYYHIQLIPLLAFCAAPLVVEIVHTLRGASRYWWMPASAALVVIMYFGYRQVNEGLHQAVFENIASAQEIGELVHHNEKTVFVAYHYGLPLEYYGQLSGAFWPKSSTYWFYREVGERELSVQERIQAFGFDPDYFVITNFNEYGRLHKDLRDYLVENCQVAAQEEDYLIYEKCVY
jgi:hypothetical protein